MKLFSILIILLIGCGGAIKPVNVPKAIPPTIVVPIVSIPKTPIREMDLLHKSIQDYTIAFVNVKEEDGERAARAYCAGVWIGVDEILTAAHCVKDDNLPFRIPIGDSIRYVVKSELESDNGINLHTGIVLAFDDANDLAFIKVIGIIPIHTIVKLGIELPAIGERVYGVGHPSQLYWSFVSGEISSYRIDSKLGDIIQVNISIWYGNSGGGLFDRDGKLIGICARKLDIPSMSNYIHLDSINRFLEGAKRFRTGVN